MELAELIEGITATDPVEFKRQLDEKIKSSGVKVLVQDSENIYVPKARFDEVNSEKKELESTIAGQTQELAVLKPLVSEVEEAKTTIASMESKLQQSVAQSKNSVVLSALAEQATAGKFSTIAPVRDLLAEFELDKLVINEDGTVTGLDTQIENVKTKKPYLFKTTDPLADPNPTADPEPTDPPTIADLLAGQPQAEPNAGNTPPVTGGTGNPGKAVASSILGTNNGGYTVGTLGSTLGKLAAENATNEAESPFFK